MGTTANMERKAAEETKSENMRRKIKEDIGTLELENMKPAIGKFVDLYLDYKEARGETATAVEADEALIQVSMLVHESVEELITVLRDSWSESKSKKVWQEEFSKHYLLVENESISEFPLIL